MIWHYAGGAPGHARVGVTPSVPRREVSKEKEVDPTPAESSIISKEAAKQTPRQLEEAEVIDWYTWTDPESDDGDDDEGGDNGDGETQM